MGDEEETLETIQKTSSKKSKSAHDLLNDEKLSKDSGEVISSEKSKLSSVKPELEGDIEESFGKNDDVNIESLRDKLKKPSKAPKRAHEEDEIILGLDENEDEMFEDEGTK